METDARVVVVLSTRYDAPLESEDGTALAYDGLRPLAVSDLVKAHVERMGQQRYKCFNPNRDNAAIQGGDSAKANGIWLKTWREALVRAQQTRGCVLLLDLEEAGLSAMQEAETDMAADKEVPVVTLRFNAQSTEATILEQLDDLSRNDQLRTSPAASTSPQPDAASRESMEEELRRLRNENRDLRERLASVTAPMDVESYS